jgi:Uma2 family endonuclease
VLLDAVVGYHLAMVARSPALLASFADLAARPERDRLEIIHGAIIERAVPSAEHSTGSAKLGEITGPFNRRPGSRGPGGWWIHVEVHVEHQPHELCCHDAAGWRRDRVPDRPRGWPVRSRPDWLCEIASPSHENNDFIDKLGILHRAEVPHYWILHPEQKMLIVHRWSRDGYVAILTATSGQVVRAEPFDAIEIAVGELFGDEPDDSPG